jgi:hypothetical protein
VVVQLDDTASHYGMPLFRPRRANQLTTQKIYRKAEKLLQQHWIRADCAALAQKAVLDRRNFGSQKLGLQKSVTKNKERSCCDRSALLKFEVNFEV